MSIRSIVLDEIQGTSALTNLIPSDNWWSSGSLEEDNAPPRPFVVIRYGATNPGIGDVKRGSVTFWVHDDLGDYSRINGVLKQLYVTLHGREHLTDGNGNEIIRLEWTTDSNDLFDPGYRTITRNTTFNLVGKGV